MHARSKAKCTAVVSTQRRERVNNSFRQRPFKSKSNAVSAEDVEEAHNGFESEETADEPSKAKTPDPPNDGCVNVVDRDLEEDDDIQFVEATPGEHLRCAPVPSTKIPDASSVEGKKMPPVTSATNQTSTLPMSTLTAAATEQIARVLEALNDEEIMQLDLDGVLEENIEMSPIKRPVKLEAILRTHRKRGTPSVGTISPSASVRNFGKADFSPDGMLAFFT